MRVVQVVEADYDAIRHIPLLQVHWAADGGLDSAARLLPADAALPVRVPAHADRARIRQGIDQAVYYRRRLDPHTARLIAAHLHRGPGSALYAFAVSGQITGRLYDELGEVQLGRSPPVGEWIDALACYCLNRKDLGPVPGWASEGW